MSKIKQVWLAVLACIMLSSTGDAHASYIERCRVSGVVQSVNYVTQVEDPVILLLVGSSQDLPGSHGQNGCNFEKGDLLEISTVVTEDEIKLLKEVNRVLERSIDWNGKDENALEPGVGLVVEYSFLNGEGGDGYLWKVISILGDGNSE